MKPSDLAWKGTTVEHKRELLTNSLKERDRLLSEGKIKDGQLQLGSTCVDIIGTATAALKEDPSNTEWKKLLDEVETISKEAVDAALMDKNDWSSSDYEVAGIILTSSDVDSALDLFRKGITKAEAEENVASKTLILGQIMKAFMKNENIDDVETALRDLDDSIVLNSPFDPKVATRVHNASAKGHKFLAIHYAKEAGSENQELKARNI